MLKVSVITPSYNYGEFLKNCIRSIKNQKGEFLVEHIICDNCSTDETGVVLESYIKDPGRVQVKVCVEKDRGQTNAINKGFEMATGDIVCWLNADEVLEPGALSRVCRYFENNNNIDVVFGWCCFEKEGVGRCVVRKEYFFSRSMLLYYGCYIPSCATFVKKTVLENGIYLDERYRVVMDYEWYVRIAYAGYRFGVIRAVLARFKWHENNISVIQEERRKQERSLVQKRYGLRIHPEPLRRIYCELARYYWIVVRVCTRSLMKVVNIT